MFPDRSLRFAKSESLLNRLVVPEQDAMLPFAQARVQKTHAAFEIIATSRRNRSGASRVARVPELIQPV